MRYKQISIGICLLWQIKLFAQNVGINVPNPFWPLEVSAAQSVARLTSTNSTFGSVLELKNSTPNSQYLGEINFNNAASSYPGQIGYKSNNTMYFLTNGQERLTIASDGKIGIGTSSPQFGLDLQNINPTIRLLGDGLYGPQLFFYNVDPAATFVGAIRFNNWGNQGGSIFYNADHTLEYYGDVNGLLWHIDPTGRMGIKRVPVTNRLEVEGTASKSTAGDWLANSDARLKKNITPLDSKEMLEKLLALKGILYEWNDDKTCSERPEGIQYGFTAQNIQDVFPTLVEEDNLGYLQTGYGTYDPMMVEALRALNDKIQALESANASLKAENDEIKADVLEIKNWINRIHSYSGD